VDAVRILRIPEIGHLGTLDPLATAFGFAVGKKPTRCAV